MELDGMHQLNELFESSDALEPRIPCKAEGCTDTFKNDLLRIQHTRRLHPELLHFLCGLCGVRCETVFARDRHRKVKHKPKPLKVSVQPGPAQSPVSQIQQFKLDPAIKIEKLVKNKMPRPSSQAKVEKACVRYARIHGKHKAQLCYARLHPEFKIGWRRLTELIQKQKSTSGLPVPAPKKSRLHSDPLLIFNPIPKAIKEACGEYAVLHGHDEAQWEFTLKYPDYVFSYASVSTWSRAAKMKLVNNPPIEFDKDFVSLLNDMLSVERELTVVEASQIIKYHVEANNKDETNLKIDYEDAEAEWLHAMNFNIFNKKNFSCPCGNVYKTEDQLNKHKPKCWILEVKEDDSNSGRSQRSCRLKSAPSECETLDSESDSEQTTLAKTGSVYDCLDCDFSTNNKATLTRHNTVCGEQQFSTNSVVYRPSSSTSQLLSFKACHHCSFKHITIEGLREHYRVVHEAHYTDNGQEISLCCSTCQETFLTYPGLREHVCNEHLISVMYEPIKPRVSMAIVLGATGSIVYICPRCMMRFENITDLQTHYHAKCCMKT